MREKYIYICVYVSSGGIYIYYWVKGDGIYIVGGYIYCSGGLCIYFIGGGIYIYACIGRGIYIVRCSIIYYVSGVGVWLWSKDVPSRMCGGSICSVPGGTGTTGRGE